jgi:type II secretory pathway component GspD/PulD (secretin)
MGEGMRKFILVACGVIVLGLWTICAFTQTEESKATPDEEQKAAEAEPQIPEEPPQMPGQPPPAGGPIPGQPYPSQMPGQPPPAGGPIPGQPYPSAPTQAEPQTQSAPSSTTEWTTETTSPISEEEVNEGVKVSKERISLDLKGIDIAELFKILSLKMGLTIVPSKGVTGRINIFLNNLSFEDALDVILISQDLAYEKKGNILNVMTSSEFTTLYGKKYNEKREFKTFKLNYAKPSTVFNALGQIKSDIGKVIVDEATGTVFLIDIPEKLALMENTIKDLDQTPQTEVFNIKYAKPADIKTQLTSAITSGTGEVFVDERSSKAVVSDLPAKMKRIKRMFKAFDEESYQVFIEAEILQISLRDEYLRGINWQKNFSEKHWDDLYFKGVFPLAAGFTPSPLFTADYLEMAVGTLARENYTAKLQLLQTYGDVKVLSRPKIAVVNNQEAKILVGQRLAYVSQTQSQAAETTVTAENVQFIDVGIKLNIKPTINKDGFITMTIKPEISSSLEPLTTALGSVVPQIETVETETVVKVKDGVMIMIAGLLKEEKRAARSGIPVLGRIPFLGAIFGTQAAQKVRTEIVIFLTPHLISGDRSTSIAEIEKRFPPDIIPEDMEEDLISKKAGEIKVKRPQEEKKLLQEDKLKAGKALPIEGEEKSVDIQEKMKGIKEY